MANKAPLMLSNLLLLLSIAIVILVAESTFLGIGPKILTLDCDTFYAAQLGDTCFAITQKFNLTTALFSQNNPNLVCEKIFPVGPQKLTLVCKTVYKAQPGETCSSIKLKFNLTTTLFNQINPNLACKNIVAGQRLCINGTFH